MSHSPATLEHIEVRHYRVPLPEVLSDATHGRMDCFALVTVALTDSDGASGVGYTYSVADIGGAAIHALLSRDLQPLLQGADAGAVEAQWQRMWWHLHFVGRGGLAASAMAAMDVALWDLRSRRAELPLWRLLGGSDPAVPAYAGGVDLQFTLAALEAQMSGFVERGFGAVKMKVGRARLAEDIERVAAMRRLLGDDFPLMADANMGWRLDQAMRAARALAPFNLVWLEEPIIPDDIDGHARIAAHSGVALATGENLHTVYEFEQMMARGGIAFPEPDLCTLGGITPWLKVAHLAEARNLPVTSHGVHDLHVHLLAAVPNASYLEVHGFGLERYLAEPLVVREGLATAPDRPGHGVEFDWQALAPHRQA